MIKKIKLLKFYINIFKQKINKYNYFTLQLIENLRLIIKNLGMKNMHKQNLPNNKAEIIKTKHDSHD